MNVKYANLSEERIEQRCQMFLAVAIKHLLKTPVEKLIKLGH
jgi:hypothetical protein